MEVCIFLTSQLQFTVDLQMFDESIIQVHTGQLIRLPELSSRLAVGEKGTVSWSILSLNIALSN